MMGWVGIDVSKDRLDVVWMAAIGQVAYGQFANTALGDGQLARWLSKRQAAGCAVCLEATGRYSQGVAH